MARGAYLKTEQSQVIVGTLVGQEETLTNVNNKYLMLYLTEDL